MQTFLIQKSLFRATQSPDYIDRSRHGSGVLIYINCSLSYSVLFKGDTDFECIILSLSCSVAIS